MPKIQFQYLKNNKLFIFFVILGLIRLVPVTLSLIENHINPLLYFLNASFEKYYALITYYVGLIGVWGILENLEKEPNPKFTVGEYKTEIKLPNITSSHIETVEFRVINDGDRSIKKDEVYYTVLVPRNLNPKVTEASPILNTNNFDPTPRNYAPNSEYIALSGMIKANIYPRRASKIFTLALEVVPKQKYTLRYYFSTESGLFPKNIVVDKNNEPIKNFGELYIDST